MHKPVLLNEVIEYLDLKPGSFLIDGTFGAGGHSVSIIEKLERNGILLAVDWDKESLQRGKKIIEANFQFPSASWCTNFQLIFENANYADLPDILKKHNLGKADGVLLDLGFSSDQIEASGRGFSFLRDEPLDMRYNRKSLTVAEVVNSFSEKDLADIFYKYGEERRSRQIAKNIVEYRREKRVLTTFDLVEAITKSNKSNRTNWTNRKIHPATRVFQALRIYVNDELGNLEKFLNNILTVLKPNGRAAIISFHSLEDRLVKNHFKDLEKEGKARILTKKPVVATREEILVNPRARSAKLRAIEITN